MPDAPDPSRLAALLEQTAKWAGAFAAAFLAVLRLRKHAAGEPPKSPTAGAGRVDTARFEAASVELKLALAEADMRGAAARIRQLEEEVRKVRACAARVDELQRQLRDSEATMRLAVVQRDSRIRELEEQLTEARRQLRMALASTDELVTARDEPPPRKADHRPG